MYLPPVSRFSPKLLMISFFLLTLGFVSGCQSEPNDFMQAIQDGDDSIAFTMLDEDLQETFGSEGEFEQWIEARRPVSWSFGSKCSANLNSARADGSGRLANDERFFITLHLRKVDESWLIQGIEHSLPQTELWGRSSELDCSD